MRLLVLTGNLLPLPSNNTNLLFKLLPFLSKNHEVRVLTTAIFQSTGTLPRFYKEFPIYWIDQDSVSPAKRKFVFPALSKILDPNGNSDLVVVLYLIEAINQIKKEYPFDVILSSSEPYSASVAASLEKAIRILYLMDPPELLYNRKGSRFRNRSFSRVLSAQHSVLTTPFILKKLNTQCKVTLNDKIIPLGFPLIDNVARNNSQNESVISLLYCGWLCSELRSPKYFLDIVSRLDERFEVTFMGKECELLQERFPIKTKAKLVTLPNQPYETALQAMADADIMVNIGNSVPVHMPSKTLEYINTGKPFVNFYKMDDCPTLYYTKRYPLCLNLSENDLDIDNAAKRFIDFCIANKRKAVDREYIEHEYEDCTPEYIAKKILDALNG